MSEHLATPIQSYTGDVEAWFGVERVPRLQAPKRAALTLARTAFGAIFDPFTKGLEQRLGLDKIAITPKAVVAEATNPTFEVDGSDEPTDELREFWFPDGQKAHTLFKLSPNDLAVPAEGEPGAEDVHRVITEAYLFTPKLPLKAMARGGDVAYRVLTVEETRGVAAYLAPLGEYEIAVEFTCS